MLFFFRFDLLYKQVGDSLLTLPQQLEPFFVQDQNTNLLAALKVGKIPYQENQGTDQCINYKKMCAIFFRHMMGL